MSMSKTQVQESLAFNLGGLLNPLSDRHLQDPEGGLEFVLDGFSARHGSTDAASSSASPSLVDLVLLRSGLGFACPC